MAASRTTLVVLAAVVTLSGCANRAPPPEVAPAGFSLRSLAKSDIDTVAELHGREVRRLLRELTQKLYRRNPRELARGAELPASREMRTAWLHSERRARRVDELEDCVTTACILLALDPSYPGDRVYALSFGLVTMIDATYQGKREFYLVDGLDPQQLYNSARNLEIAAWKMRSALATNGEPLVLSNSRAGEPSNLSYERLFGKLIALQDMLARIVAGKQNRTIKHVVLRLMTAVFLPI